MSWNQQNNQSQYQAPQQSYQPATASGGQGQKTKEPHPTPPNVTFEAVCLDAFWWEREGEEDTPVLVWSSPYTYSDGSPSTQWQWLSPTRDQGFIFRALNQGQPFDLSQVDLGDYNVWRGLQGAVETRANRKGNTTVANVLPPGSTGNQNTLTPDQFPGYVPREQYKAQQDAQRGSQGHNDPAWVQGQQPRPQGPPQGAQSVHQGPPSSPPPGGFVQGRQNQGFVKPQGPNQGQGNQGNIPPLPAPPNEGQGNQG